MAGKFELKTTKNGLFHFNLLAGNGQIILASELYESKASALNGIESVKKNAVLDGSYQRFKSSNGKPYFVLKAGSGQVIGKSEMYESEAGRDNGIEAVKKNARDPIVEAKFEIKTSIGAVTTFLKELGDIKIDEEHLLFFRGHSDASYLLMPSIYRNAGWIKNEDLLFKELILRCPSDFDFTESTFQTLVKMQHFSLPTRLLDLTSNPLIALYFATSEKSEKSDGEVVIFKIPKKEIKYYDSDTVSVIANISRRPVGFALQKKKLSVNKFNELDEIKFLLHEIRKEKPYFQPLINKDHLESVVCVKPKLSNARILKQDGAFFLFGIKDSKESAAKIPAEYLVTSAKPFIIDRSSKAHIRGQLKTLGITQGTIYPDIDNVANFLKEEYLSR